MDLQTPSFPVYLCIFFFLFIFILAKKNKQNKNSSSPPGPWKFPLIGNIPQLAGALPHQRLIDLAKIHGPIMSIQLGQVPSIVISSAEIAKEVLKTHDAQFAGRPRILAAEIVYYNCMDIVFGEYGDHWRQLKKICTVELLSAKRVQSFQHIRAQEIANFVDFLCSNAASQSPVNLTQTIFALTNSIMAITAVGEKCRNQDALLNVIDRVTEASAGFSVADLFPSFKFLHYLSGEKSKLVKLHKDTDRVLEEIINEHKANRRSGDSNGEVQNLLDVLLDLQKNGDFQVPLTNDSIKGTILEMFGAGSDTSSKTTEWAMTELMRHPTEMSKAQEEVRQVFGKNGKVDESRLHELKYLKLIVKEIFRIHPPGALIPRECMERTKINGYDIHPTTKVMINVWGINRDPSIWIEPTKFFPERFRDSLIDYKGTHFELIPFGAGKRICPGITLGILNLELFLANFLYHFDWKFPDGITAENIDMAKGLGGVLRRKTDLQLIPILPLLYN